jgi:hypothetical protein
MRLYHTTLWFIYPRKHTLNYGDVLWFIFPRQHTLIYGDYKEKQTYLNLECVRSCR